MLGLGSGKVCVCVCVSPSSGEPPHIGHYSTVGQKGQESSETSPLLPPLYVSYIGGGREEPRISRNQGVGDRSPPSCL